MQDLTKGSIARNIAKMSVMMFVGMVMQTLYLLLDLYFVGRLGSTAVAAVSVAGNLSFAVTAATQVLAVGTTAIVSHATGAKDRALATSRFNQSQVLSLAVGGVFFLSMFFLSDAYVAKFAADPETARSAADYLVWFIPALALQFPLFANAAALRGTGNFGTGLVVQAGSVVLNIVLAPVLIFGWGTGHPLGVAGAAIASFIAVAVGLVAISAHVLRRSSFLHFSARDWAPRLSEWWNILKIGLPAGAELALLSVYIMVVYLVSRPFGSQAQAGFGVGLRVLQAAMLPAVALGIAVSPVAGQNFAARRSSRVRESFRVGAGMSAVLMAAITLICILGREALVLPFSKDPQVVAISHEYLAISALTLIPTGLNFVASSLFQAMGNTVPSLVSSATRTTILVLAIYLLASSSDFELRWIWYLAVATTLLQLGMNLLLLGREFARRLPAEAPAETVNDAIEAAGIDVSAE